MKKIIMVVLLLLGAQLLIAQNENLKSDPIPEQLTGSWWVDLPGEGEIPSQIMRWVFSKQSSTDGISEFQWLFKRPQDKDFLVVAKFVYNFTVQGNTIHMKLVKVGSQQKQGTMEFYEEVQWYSKGDELFDRSGQKELKPQFQLKDNALMLMEDYNNDGDFDDNEEIQKYTKEEGHL